MSCVGECLIQQTAVRRVVRPSRLVPRELGAREARIRQRISWISRHGLLEVGNCFRDLLDVECLEPHPALGKRSICLETVGFDAAARMRVNDRDSQFLGKLLDDCVLKLEDLTERTIDFRIGERLSARDVDDSSRDANAIAVSLKAADDGEADAEIGGHPGSEPSVRRAASMTRQRSTTRKRPSARRSPVTVSAMPARQPRRVGVAGDVGEVEDCQCVFVGDCGRSDGA